MNVVGLGGSGHEWSSCAIGDKGIYAISEERLWRRKYGLGVDLLAARSRKSCLGALGIHGDHTVPVVACSLVPRAFYHGVRERTHIINHHLAHAYSSFCASGFERAAVLVADNSGSILDGTYTGTTRTVETISLFDAGPDGISLVHRVEGEHLLDARTESDFFQPGATTNSLGHFYRSASLALGFKYQGPDGTHPFSEDGKTMGLAPYGDDRYIDHIGELIDLLPDGGIKIPASIEPVLELCLGRGNHTDRAALAFAVQHHLERALLHIATHLRERTGHENLCIAGGVGLNSVANGLLQRASGFKRVYVVPAPSDDGISLGCAYWGLHNLFGVSMKDIPSLATSYLGPEQEPGAADRALKRYGLAAEACDTTRKVAEELSRGAFVGWYQGRSEFGPRALGHRTILARPFPAATRDVLNHEIKRREWFRPYGPMVPLELAQDWFDFDGESLYMSFVAPVRRPAEISAGTHVDGTARLQTVRREANPAIHALLHEFGSLTGVPVLINTSFNTAGEPIVETPEEAIDTAIRMGLDLLVLDSRVVRLPNRR